MWASILRAYKASLTCEAMLEKVFLSRAQSKVCSVAYGPTYSYLSLTATRP